jgi:D-alanyl-D-alanine carboxypeptidase/D-alanyl-D-alanine-endopeptidase (penicillin-binding protein 4)
MRAHLFVILAPLACAAGRAAVAPAPYPVVAVLRSAIDSMVTDRKFRAAEFGILVVDPERGDTLYSHNAGKLFMPASNQKILTSAVALHLLGPDFRYSTTIAASAPARDGVIGGDLIVSGTGDPTISDHMRGDAMAPLRQIADSLEARGIQRVSGRLRSGLDAFPDATIGYGWAWDDLDFNYSAGVDELYFNEGFTRIIVRGGSHAGDVAEVHTAPARTYPRVVGLVTTVARDTTPRRNRLSARQDSTDAGAVIVSGTVAAGDSAEAIITFRDNAAAYLEALREALADKSIWVDGGVWSHPPDSARARPLPDSATTDSEPQSRPPSADSGVPLFSMVSPPLRDILSPFLKPSQNQIGEVLLKTLGRSGTGVGTADSGAAVVSRQLLEWGALPDGFVVRDGSGLSRHDMVSPETIVRVLTVMQRDPAFNVWYEALPIAGVDGTIATRMRNTAAQNNVHAKTGSLDMVRSLSGYVTTADGHRLVFSILANNWTVPASQVTALQDAIAARLAELQLARP